MEPNPLEMTYDIFLKPGELLRLPEQAGKILGPGHWQVSIRPAETNPAEIPIRDHSAFLNGYSPEDEGLYDDYLAR